MKRILSMVLAASALLLGVWSCEKPNTEPLESVDLRYRADDVYNIGARNASVISIVVTSTAPWSLTSVHPDWCIIETEEGEASDPQKVLEGKGDKTTVRIQYYDNLQLDDRTDTLVIRTENWIGKKVVVNQKGIAYLDISEEEQAPVVVKDGGETTIHIAANQDWSVAVTDGEWLSVSGPDTGSNDGTFTVTATKNASWQRYATVTVYDRHGVVMYEIVFTQDGVQIDPELDELRVGFDQKSATLNVVSNSKWTVLKSNENDDWFTIENPDHEGNGTINITFTENPGTALRKTNIIIQSVSENPDDFKAERNIVLKQAYFIAPVRYLLDNDEMSLWKSDQAKTPVYTKGVGTYFENYARLNRNPMPFGNYKFSWTSIDPAARIRHWFCYSDGQELKYNLKAASKEVVVDFNSSSAGISGKPADIVDSYPLDPAGTHTFELRFAPSGETYCRVTYYVDDIEVTSFESSDTVMHKVTYGAEINMYVGVDTGGSAVCEWYEYTAPVNWDE